MSWHDRLEGKVSWHASTANGDIATAVHRSMYILKPQVPASTNRTLESTSATALTRLLAKRPPVYRRVEVTADLLLGWRQNALNRTLLVLRLVMSSFSPRFAHLGEKVVHLAHCEGLELFYELAQAPVGG